VAVGLFSFGDGNTASFSHPPPNEVSHTYGSSSCFSNTPGGEANAFAVTLSANNLCGNATNIVEPIRIHQSPAPDMFGIGSVCAGPTFLYEALGNGTDDFGFLALPGGLRATDDGSFGDAGNGGGWWSSSPYEGSAWCRVLYYADSGSTWQIRDPRYGFSVRCLRDAD